MPPWSIFILVSTTPSFRSPLTTITSERARTEERRERTTTPSVARVDFSVGPIDPLKDFVNWKREGEDIKDRRGRY